MEGISLLEYIDAYDHTRGTIHPHPEGWGLLYPLTPRVKLDRALLITEELDHIDHNGLNNTIDNLRIVTHQQNSMNRRKRNTNTSSHYKNVYWAKDRSKWRADIMLNGKHIHLGQFSVETDAARAVDAAAKLYFGEYANLNFPETP